jgi:hypothetical protein
VSAPITRRGLPAAAGLGEAAVLGGGAPASLDAFARQGLRFMHARPGDADRLWPQVIDDAGGRCLPRYD